MLGHALDAERQHHGEDCSKAFWHCGDRKRHGKQQGFDDVIDAVEAFHNRECGEHHRGDDAHGDTQHLGNVCHFLLQRGLLVFRPRQHIGDFADLRVHACASDNGTPGALGDGCAVEHHVHAVAQRFGAVKGLGLLRDRHGFAGQACLRDTQGCSGEQSAVSGDRIAFAEDEDIARHDVRRVDAHHLTVTQHGGLRGGHTGKRRNRLFCFCFLDVAEHRVDDEDQHDDDGVERERLGG